MRKRRELLLDVLPERYPYKDDGCAVSPSCLVCPLPKCRHDDPGWLQEARRQARDDAIRRARRLEDLTVVELSRRFGVSQRTVFRALAAGRNGNDRGGCHEP
ncbi:MAG: hypothetical protein HY686_00450 [Chloroflexi bacterium]|nr:hypothetical protein [Chloroflexota bacterium]